MTFSVDVYGHSNSDFFLHNQTHQIQKHILSDKSNAHFVNTCSLFTFQMSKWRHHYRKKCNFVHIATSSFLVEQFCDTESCMANQKDGHGDLHCMCHLLVHVSLISVYNNNCVIKLYIYDLMSSEQFL